MKEIEKSVHAFNDEVISMGYQPADEDEIRGMLDEVNWESA